MPAFIQVVVLSLSPRRSVDQWSLRDGTGFSLVPWSSVLEQRMGRAGTASVRRATTTLGFHPHRGIRD